MIDNTLLDQLAKDARQDYLEHTEEEQAKAIAFVKASNLHPAGKAIILFAMTEEVSYLEEVVNGGAA